MRVSVGFQDESVEFDLSPESLVGSWSGPAGANGEVLIRSLRSTLEHPIEYPPLRQMVVPGDRVAIALDGALIDVRPLLAVIAEILTQSGVAGEDVTVVTTAAASAELSGNVPAGMNLVTHDPADSRSLAYLAATRDGRRIYLNRQITDADVVLPVGRLGFDSLLGYRGPWSVLFPGLSDATTLTSYRLRLEDDPADAPSPEPRYDESFEVSWLLGTQMHLGIVPGASGTHDMVAGLADQARDVGIRALRGAWIYQAPARADCVVVGIGLPDRPAGIDDLVEGLVTASRLVSQGGRIVALSRVSGSMGPSLQRLASAGDARLGTAALRGHEADADSVVGRRLAQVLDWADVYLLSMLDRQMVEDLSMIALDHLDDARRLVSRSGSCLLVSHGDLTRAAVRGPRRTHPGTPPHREASQ
jgi:hypothetical protein